MDTMKLKKGLRDLRNSIEDFLDNMDLDAEEAASIKKPEKGKLSSDVEEDDDSKKKEH